MHITCEGKAYELFEGATPQNLWNMVSGGRDRSGWQAISFSAACFMISAFMISLCDG